MKKQIFIIIGLLLVSGLAIAQNKNIKRANKLFEKRAYTKAAELYEKKERSVEVLKNLADCYYYNSNHEKASKVYEELYANHADSIDKEYHFRYAQALKGNKNYKESDKYFSLYYNQPINTLAFLEETEKTTPHIFKLKEIVNEESNSDFGISFYDDTNDEETKVVFASARNVKNRSYAWNGLPYLDMFIATLTDENVLEHIEPLSEINTAMHESNVVVTKDGNTMYFNRTSGKRVKIDGNKVAHIKIYKAELLKGFWKNITELPFSSDNYSTVHPVLSKDEKTLYFSSDMPDSYGSYDIYRVSINKNGTYGDPENLGPKINTEQVEQFPFISESNVLYFSSTGHQGYGGLDVFRSDMVNGNFEEPVNLGGSVNSNFDDFSFVVREKDNIGFVSSNKSGIDKLYSFGREINPLTIYEVEGVIEDIDSKELMEDALVTLLDEFDEEIQDTIVAYDGYYNFKLEPNKKYKVNVTREGYAQENVEFSTDSIAAILEQNIYITPDALVRESVIAEIEAKLNTVLFGFDEFNISEESAAKLDTLVDVMQKYPSMGIQVSGYTDSRGSKQYNLNLSKSRANSTVEYLVSKGVERERIQSMGYGELKPLKECTNESKCSNADYAINRRCEFTVSNLAIATNTEAEEKDDSIDDTAEVKIDVDKEEVKIAKEEEVITEKKADIKIDNILFDFNKSNINEEEAAKLDALFDVMQKNPLMKIEVSAHTDIRGSNQYNLYLSKSRADSTVEYLVSRGIDRDRIQSSIAYGELQPLNDCVNDGSCSEIEHSANRRCEFTILNY